MNVATHAHSLYGQARSLKTPRDLEYDVIAQITGRLRQAMAGDDATAMPGRIAALHENRRLWTVLALDLAHPDNAFPTDLRARLAYLADYTSRTTDRCLDAVADSGALVDSLIEINTIVMRGLRGEAPR